jgi:hypothetical protein
MRWRAGAVKEISHARGRGKAELLHVQRITQLRKLCHQRSAGCRRC